MGQKRSLHGLAGVTRRAGLTETIRGNVAVLSNAHWLRHRALRDRAQGRREVRLRRFR